MNFTNLINIFNYEIKLKLHWILVILLIIILAFIILIIIIIGSYLLFKVLKINIENKYIYLKKYNKDTQQILDMYGDCKISQVHIVRQPLSKYLKKSLNMVLNVMIHNDFKHIFDNNDDINIYHASIIIKIKLPNKLNKFILIEKNPSINISENINIKHYHNIKSLYIKKHKYTLNNILNRTNKRIGDDKFFNWHFYKNNCQDFIRELLITINKSNYIKNFLSHKKITSKIYSCGFYVHTINIIITISNIFEKYFIS